MIVNSLQVFFEFSRTWKVQFAHGTLQADDGRTTTVPSQRLWFLHDICSFSSLQIPATRITGGHVVNVLSFIDHYM